MTSSSSRMAGVLAAVFFFTQCLFAQEVEKSFWAERRRVSSPRGTEVAAAPSLGVPAASLLSLLQEQPRDRFLAGEPLPASVPLNASPGLVSLLEKFPTTWASVRKITPPSSGKTSGPVVLLLQDVHLNSEAQENIGAALQSLLQNDQVSLVGLEGSRGILPLPPFRQPWARSAVKTTADFLLAEKEISGALHAGLVSSGAVPPFLGVDSPRHYAANVAAYRATRAKEGAYKDRLRVLERRLAEEKKNHFNGALQNLESQVEAHRTGQLGLGDYVESLTGGGSALKNFPNVEGFWEALRLERGMDLKAVETDRAGVVSELVRRLSPRGREELVRESAAHRMGRMSLAEFYARLEKRCAGVGLSLRDHPHLERYLRYLHTADRVDAELLGEELQRLEETRLHALARSPRERAILERARALYWVRRLLDFSLTPAEWRAYKRENGLSPLGESFPLEPFERFYREAEIRDGVMAGNLLRAVQSHGAQTAVLVAGGFHTPGILRVLTKAGATVVSATPKLTRGDERKGAPDLGVFAREKMPLDVLFQGEKLFVTPTPWSSATAGKIALVAGADLAREGSLSVAEAWRRFLPGRGDRFWVGALSFWNTSWVWIQNRRKGTSTWLTLKWNAQGGLASLRSGRGDLGGHRIASWLFGFFLPKKYLQRKKRMLELKNLFLQMPPQWLRPTPGEVPSPGTVLEPDEGIQTLHKIAVALSKIAGSSWDWNQWLRSQAESLPREQLDRWTYFLEEIQRLNRSKEWGWRAYGLTWPWVDPDSSEEDVPPPPGFLFGVARGASVLGKAASRPWVDELNRLVLDDRQKVLESFIERAFVMEQKDGKILEKGALVSRAVAEHVLEAVQKYWNEHQLSHENRDFEWVARKCLIHPEGFLNYQSEFSLWRNYELFKKHFGTLGLATIAMGTAEHLSGTPLARHREVFSGTYWTEEGVHPSAAIDVEMLLDAVGPLARVLYGRKNLLSRDGLSKLEWEDPDYQYFRGLTWALQEKIYQDADNEGYWNRLIEVLAKSIPAHRLSRFHEEIDFFAMSLPDNKSPFSNYTRDWRSSYSYGLILIQEAVQKAQAAEDRKWKNRIDEMELEFEVADESLAAFLKTSVDTSGIPLDRQEVWNREIPRMGQVGSWEMWLLALLVWKFPQERDWNFHDRHFQKLAGLGSHLSQLANEMGYIPWEEIPFLQETPEAWDRLVFLLKEIKYLSLSDHYNWRARGIRPPWVSAENDSVENGIEETDSGVLFPPKDDSPEDEKNKKAFLTQMDEGIRFFQARAVDAGVNSFFNEWEGRPRNFQNYSSINMRPFYSWGSSLLLNQSIAQEVFSRIQNQWKESGDEESSAALAYRFVRVVLSPPQTENLLWRNFKLFQKVADPQGFAIVLLTTAGHLRNISLEKHLGPDGRLFFQTEEGPLTKGLIDLEFLFRSLGPVLRAVYPREGPPLDLLSEDPERFPLGLYLRYAIANVLDPSLYQDGEKSHLDRLIQILRHNIPPQHRAAFFKDMGDLCDPQGDRNARFYGLKLPAEVTGSIAQYPIPESRVLDFTAFRESSERVNPLLLPYYRAKDGEGDSEDIEAYLTGIEEIKKAFETWGRSTMVSDPRSYWIHSVAPVAVKFLIGVVAGMAGFPVVLGTLDLRTDTPSPHWQREWEKDFSRFLALIDDELKKASLRPVPAVDSIGEEHSHMGEAGLFESQMWIHHFSPGLQRGDSPEDTGAAQAWRVAVRLVELLQTNGSIPWDRLGDFPPGKFHSVLLILQYLSRSEKFGWTAHGWVSPWNEAEKVSREDPTGGTEGETRKNRFLEELDKGLAWFEKKAVEQKVGELFQAKAVEGPSFDPADWIVRTLLPASEIQHAEPLLQKTIRAFLERWKLPTDVAPGELMGVLWVPRAIVKERRLHSLLRNYRAFEKFAGPVAHAFLLLVTAAHFRFVSLRQHLLAFRKSIHTEDGDIPEGAVDVEYLFKSLGKVLEATYPAGRDSPPMDPTGKISLGLFYRYALLSVLDGHLFSEPSHKYFRKFLQVLEKSLPPEHRAAFFQDMSQLADPNGRRNFAYYGLRHPSDFSLGMEMSWFLQFPTMPLLHRAWFPDFLSRLLEPFGYSIRDGAKETAYFKGIKAIESALNALEHAREQIRFFEENSLPELMEIHSSSHEKTPPSPRVQALWELTETLFEMHGRGGIPWVDLFKKLDSPALGRWALVLEEVLRYETSEKWGWGQTHLPTPGENPLSSAVGDRLGFQNALRQGIAEASQGAVLLWQETWKFNENLPDLRRVIFQFLASSDWAGESTAAKGVEALRQHWESKKLEEKFGSLGVYLFLEGVCPLVDGWIIQRNHRLFPRFATPMEQAVAVIAHASHLRESPIAAHRDPRSPGRWPHLEGDPPALDLEALISSLEEVLKAYRKIRKPLPKALPSWEDSPESLYLFAIATALDLDIYEDPMGSHRARLVGMLHKILSADAREELLKEIHERTVGEGPGSFKSLGFPHPLGLQGEIFRKNIHLEERSPVLGKMKIPQFLLQVIRSQGGDVDFKKQRGYEENIQGLRVELRKLEQEMRSQKGNARVEVLALLAVGVGAFLLGGVLWGVSLVGGFAVAWKWKEIKKRIEGFWGGHDSSDKRDLQAWTSWMEANFYRDSPSLKSIKIPFLFLHALTNHGSMNFSERDQIPLDTPSPEVQEAILRLFHAKWEDLSLGEAFGPFGFWVVSAAIPYYDHIDALRKKYNMVDPYLGIFGALALVFFNALHLRLYPPSSHQEVLAGLGAVDVEMIELGLKSLLQYFGRPELTSSLEERPLRSGDAVRLDDLVLWTIASSLDPQIYLDKNSDYDDWPELFRGVLKKSAAGIDPHFMVDLLDRIAFVKDWEKYGLPSPWVATEPWKGYKNHMKNIFQSQKTIFDLLDPRGPLISYIEKYRTYLSADGSLHGENENVKSDRRRIFENGISASRGYFYRLSQPQSVGETFGRTVLSLVKREREGGEGVPRDWAKEINQSLGPVLSLDLDGAKPQWGLFVQHAAEIFQSGSPRFQNGLDVVRESASILPNKEEALRWTQVLWMQTKSGPLQTQMFVSNRNHPTVVKIVPVRNREEFDRMISVLYTMTPTLVLVDPQAQLPWDTVPQDRIAYLQKTEKIRIVTAPPGVFVQEGPIFTLRLAGVQGLLDAYFEETGLKGVKCSLNLIVSAGEDVDWSTLPKESLLWDIRVIVAHTLNDVLNAKSMDRVDFENIRALAFALTQA